MSNAKLALLTACLMCGPAISQTKVSIESQAKSFGFLSPPFAKPLRSGASLPAACVVGELFFLLTAPAGNSIQVCHQENAWAPQGSAGQANVTVQNEGVTVGVRPTINFVPGDGISQLVTDLGNQINVQQSLDTSYLLTKAKAQTGEIHLCGSLSGSATTYSCGMMPSLGVPAAGMILHWRPDVPNAAGGITLSPDLKGPYPVKLADGTTNPPSGAFAAGRLYPLWFDGAALRVTQSPMLERFQTIASSQAGTLHYCVSTGGSGSSYTCTLPEPLSSYTTGMVVHWRADVAGSGGAMTLKIGALAPVAIKSQDGISSPDSSQVLAGQLYLLWFDGSVFRLVGDSPRGIVLRSELQSGAALFCASHSVGGVFSCNLNRPIAAHLTGEVLHWVPDAGAAGDSISLVVDGLAPVAVKRPDGVHNPISGDFHAGELKPIWYDGTVFRLLVTSTLPTVGETRPTCAAVTRGLNWLLFGDVSEADNYSVCTKDEGGAYAWRTLYE